MNRIDRSLGAEMLFEIGWRIIAISQPVLDTFKICPSEARGKRLGQLPMFEPFAGALEEIEMFGSDQAALQLSLIAPTPWGPVCADIDMFPLATLDGVLLTQASVTQASEPISHQATKKLQVVSIRKVSFSSNDKKGVTQIS